MKILFVNSSYPHVRCGIGDYTKSLAEELGKSPTHRVTVITTISDQIERVSERVKVRPIIPEWEWREFFRNYRSFFKEWPDVIVVQYPSVMLGERAELTFWLPALARFFLPASKVLFIAHEFVRTHQSAKEELIKRSFRFSHRVLLVDPADYQEIATIEPRLARKIQVLPYPTGSSVPFHPASKQRLEELRSSIARADASLVLFFGFLTSPEKGFEDLVHALTLPTDKSVILLATGRLEDYNPYHRRISTLLQKTGLSERVRWLGHLPEESLSQWLQAADLIVLPFRSGASASRTSLVAAIANRSAVVTTRSPYTPEIFKDRQNVLLVRAGHPESLNNAIQEALSSPSLLGQLREGAAALAPQFEWSAVASDVLNSISRPLPRIPSSL